MTLDAILSNLVSSYGAFNIASLMASISNITFVVIALSILPVLRKNKRAAMDYLAVIITTAFFSIFFQQFFARPRPHSALLQHVESIYSFPSTHSSSSFAWAAFMSGKYRRYTIIFYVFAALVAVSRVYIGVHYPGDVIAGAVLGYAIAAILKRSNNYGNISRI